MEQVTKAATMYALDKKGKIRAYESGVDYMRGVYVLWSEAGILGGRKVRTEKLVDRGKNIGKANETTAEQQAVSMLRSKINDKKDEGYKTFDDLVLRANELSIPIADIEEGVQTVPYLYQKLGITYNTSSVWTPLPMLAAPYKEGAKFGERAMQTKLAGVRNMAQIIDGEIKMMSRGGKFYYKPTLVSHLQSIFEQYPNILLDGELYKHGIPESTISGEARRDQDSDWLQYHIYDAVLPGFNQAKRLELLGNLRKVQTDLVKVVPTIRVSEHREVMKFHDLWVSEGYEGGILRDLSAPYMFSFRDKCLWKVKKFKEEEFLITGVNIDLTVGIASFKFNLETKDGKTFDSAAMGSHSQWLQYYNDFKAGHIVGHKATVRFFDYSIHGIPEKGKVKQIRDYE